jgi:hypothetical protein
VASNGVTHGATVGATKEGEGITTKGTDSNKAKEPEKASNKTTIIIVVVVVLLVAAVAVGVTFAVIKLQKK